VPVPDMYRHLHLDLASLPLMVGRGLSDRAIGRLLGCSRWTVLNRRRRLGIVSPWALMPDGATRRAAVRARHAELDRLWARLSLDEKVGRLLQLPQRFC
jgi:hypothetical protein